MQTIEAAMLHSIEALLGKKAIGLISTVTQNAQSL